MSVPSPGDPAPDFVLPGVQREGAGFARRDFALADERGHPVVLVFYPGDESVVCTAQLCSYQRELAQFTGLDAAVLAISPQGLASHERFARKEGLAFPLLADEGGAAVTAYGVGSPVTGLRRSVFLIDAAGVVRWRHVALVGATFRGVREIRRHLEEIAA